MSIFTASMFALAFFLGQPSTAQGGEPAGGQEASAGKKKSSGVKALDARAVAEKLAKFKTSIAAKVIPQRITRRGSRKVKKWMKSFQAVQSKHYLVYTNGPRATCRKFAKSLEKLYVFMQKRFAFADLSHHLECYIFKTEGEYYDFCVKVAGWSMEEAKRSAGHAMAHYYTTYYQSPTSDVVMHEAAHQIVSACLKVPGVGSWFQEGFAVYVEKKISNAKVSATIRSDLKLGTFYSLSKMVGIPSLLGDVNGYRNYDHAGTILEFMIETKLEPLRGKFTTFLKAARRGYARGTEVTERLFQKVYGLSIDEFDALWKKHYLVPNARPGQRASRIRKKSR